MSNAPFIVYGIPRSRTAWISMFLSYKDCVCHHEKAMFMRSMQDVRDLFSTPNTGTVETAASYGRCLIKWLIPNIKEVVILRPVEECVESLMRLDLSSIGTSFDRKKVERLMKRGRATLDKIAKDPNVLVINYTDLDKEETIKQLFEFCLPYDFDRAWWLGYHEKNIQLNIPLLLLYRLQNKSAIDAFKSLVKRELFRLGRLGELTLRSN